MATSLQILARRCRLCLTLGWLSATGCATEHLLCPDPPSQCSRWVPVAADCAMPQDPAVIPASSPAPELRETSVEGPLSLPQLLDLAARQNPEVAIARARVDAARGLLIQAGLYPNPTVTWESEDVGSKGKAAGNEGPIIAQRIVTGGKRRLAQEAAAQGVAAADWQAVSRWFDVVGRVRLAYYDLLTAQQEVQTHEEIVRLAQEGLEVAQKLKKAGIGGQPDVLRAQVELDHSRVQLATARQRSEAAAKLLAAAVGLNALPSTQLAESLEAAVPNYAWQSLVDTVLARSSEIQEAQANVLQAERLLERARAEIIPDLQLSVRPLYAFVDQRPEVTVQAGAMLPIFNRNQGNIYAAQADSARANAVVRQVELRLTERLTAAFRRYQSAKQQAEAYAKQILPNAKESLRLVRLGYEKGDAKYQYTAVLEAQRTLVQAQLANVQALGELWRAVSELTALLQLDQLPGGAEKR